MPSCSCTTSSRRCGAPPPAPYTTPLPAPALRSSAQAAFSGRSIAAESSRSPSHPGTSGRGSYAAPHRRATGPPVTVVRTSEHWWEDEEEFDALTEMLAPKRILISTGAQGAIAQGGLQGVEFATCLTAEAVREEVALPRPCAALGGGLGAEWDGDGGRCVGEGQWRSRCSSETDHVPALRRKGLRCALPMLQQHGTAQHSTHCRPSHTATPAP